MSEPAANATEFTNNKNRKDALKNLIDAYRLQASNVDDPKVMALGFDELSTNDTTPELTGTVSNTTATLELIVDGASYTPTNNADGTWTLADGSTAALAVDTYSVYLIAYDAASEQVGLHIAHEKLEITA